jgi:CheY-like chemotaxis protein
LLITLAEALEKTFYFNPLQPIAQNMILVVDDDDAYQWLLPRLFDKAKSPVSLQFVFDGNEAIDYLNGNGKFSDRAQFPLPKMILLDLKMPKVNGFEFLEWRRNQAIHGHIPVVVWSSSDLQSDKDKSAELGAVDYIEKPIFGHGLLEAIERIYVRLTEARAKGAISN